MEIRGINMHSNEGVGVGEGKVPDRNRDNKILKIEKNLYFPTFVGIAFLHPKHHSDTREIPGAAAPYY